MQVAYKKGASSVCLRRISQSKRKGNDDKHTLLAKNAQQKKNNTPSRAEVNQGRF
jgi:hypothetical protein